MPVPGRIGASAAADVEDAPEFAPDPVQEVRSIAGVVVGGFRDHHDGSLLADRRLPRWHRVLTQGPTVPRRSARPRRHSRGASVPLVVGRPSSRALGHAARSEHGESRSRVVPRVSFEAGLLADRVEHLTGAPAQVCRDLREEQRAPPVAGHDDPVDPGSERHRVRERHRRPQDGDVDVDRRQLALGHRQEPGVAYGGRRARGGNRLAEGLLGDEGAHAAPERTGGGYARRSSRVTTTVSSLSFWSIAPAVAPDAAPIAPPTTAPTGPPTTAPTTAPATPPATAPPASSSPCGAPDT